ncbi:MAG: rRNA methyltransferase [Bacteroidota bacterium]|jgi:23S rRNA (adenine1618-N6)-methyltransferase|nr:rRNA methyltransferase [Bacteroidota bacterium]
MKENSGNDSEIKTNLHPRNKHRAPYNFRELVSVSGELQQFLSGNKYKNESIDFSDPKAVKALNKALLKQFYEISYWDIPDGYLCPAIPGRADYIHYIADLLAESNNGVIPQGDSVSVLDLGVGANCVYPIIGRKEYGWHFTASDVDPVAINSAKKIITSNKVLVHGVDCKLQTDGGKFFKDIIEKDSFYNAVICNPPFHTSAEAAAAGTERKNKNLGSKRVADGSMNFGGQNNELIYKGGEASFIYYMILESVEFAKNVLWFSTLVSDKHHLPAIYKTLEKVKATKVKTINMSQGQKKSRIVAWTFMKEGESVVRSS